MLHEPKVAELPPPRARLQEHPLAGALQREVLVPVVNRRVLEDDFPNLLGEFWKRLEKVPVLTSNLQLGSHSTSRDVRPITE